MRQVKSLSGMFKAHLRKNMMNDPVLLNGQNFTLGQLVDIARDGRAAAVSRNSESRIKKARTLVEQWVKAGKRIYGVTTGFGALSNVGISFEDAKTLQRNILLSHAAGVGGCMDDDVVRAMMALRINNFCRGNSAAPGNHQDSFPGSQCRVSSGGA